MDYKNILIIKKVGTKLNQTHISTKLKQKDIYED